MKVNVNPAIFKAYDIRGIYPQDLSGEGVFLIGRVFVKFLGETRIKKSGKLKIAVGRDNRLSGPILSRNLIRGITNMGADVVDLGLVTTPMLYFAVARYRYDGGIIITASHNPKEYNGLKMVRENAGPISAARGIKEIQHLTELPLQSNGLKGAVFSHKGMVLKDYVAFNLKNINKSDFKGLKIVVDTANAVSGIIIPEIFKALPCRITHLFKKSDGRYPNRSPDPSLLENLKALRAAVLVKKADLGVAFDGDGDRIIFVDEKGEVVSGNFIAALMADLILKRQPGEKIFYDVRSSNIIKEIIESRGGKPIVGRIGHSFIKERMRKEQILFASELSGHYYHKDHYFCDAPFFVLFTILKELKGKTFSQLVKPYQKYHHSGEINLEIKDKESAINKLKSRYSNGKILTIDGLRVDYDDWWFLARPSNTEPVLRLVIEAKTKDLLDKKKEELSALLNLEK